MSPFDPSSAGDYVNIIHTGLNTIFTGILIWKNTRGKGNSKKGDIQAGTVYNAETMYFGETSDQATASEKPKRHKRKSQKQSPKKKKK